MKKLLKKYGFTLVELIVVVVILAVLAALAFMMVSKWIGASKDSNRISTIAIIRRGIDMNYIEKGSYPFPDDDNEEGKVITGTVNGKIVLYKGTIGDNVIKNLGNTLTKVPLDPIGKRYAYGITASGKEYEIGTVLENETKLGILDKAYALNYKAKLEGTYGGMIVFSTGGKQYIANIPSLVFTVSGSVTTSMNMLSNNIYYAINSGNNLPYTVTTKSDAQKDNINAVIKSKTKSTTATVQSVEIPTATDLSTIFNGDVLTSFGGNLGTIQNEIKRQSGITTTASIPCGVVANGGTKAFYDVSNVPYVDNNCEAHKKVFTCENGVWKDGTNLADTATYQYLACSIGTPTNCTSTTYNGYIIPDTTHALSGSTTKDVSENNGTFRYTQNFECNNGTFNYTSITGPEYVSCNENYNRNGTSCAAIAGVCGTSNGGKFATTPSTNLCTTGTPSAVSYSTGMGNYTWSCTAGTIVNCKAYDTYTVLLMHFNGSASNSGTNISTITNNGSVTFSSAGVFGNSAYFNGSSYLTMPDSADWDFTSTNGTIDFWLNFSSLGNYNILGQTLTTNDGNRFVFTYTAGNIGVSINGVNQVISSASQFTAGVRYHIAIVRNGTLTTIYKNGVSIASGTTGVWNNSANVFNIGRRMDAGGWGFPGYIDELRISKGIIRWSGDFSYPSVEY